MSPLSGLCELFVAELWSADYYPRNRAAGNHHRTAIIVAAWTHMDWHGLKCQRWDSDVHICIYIYTVSFRLAKSLAWISWQVGLYRRHRLQLVRRTPLGLWATFVCRGQVSSLVGSVAERIPRTTKSNERFERCGYCILLHLPNNKNAQKNSVQIQFSKMYRSNPMDWVLNSKFLVLPAFFRPSTCITPTFGSLDPRRLVTGEVAAAM